MHTNTPKVFIDQWLGLIRQFNQEVHLFYFIILVVLRIKFKALCILGKQCTPASAAPQLRFWIELHSVQSCFHRMVARSQKRETRKKTRMWRDLETSALVDFNFPCGFWGCPSDHQTSQGTPLTDPAYFQQSFSSCNLLSVMDRVCFLSCIRYIIGTKSKSFEVCVLFCFVFF